MIWKLQKTRRELSGDKIGLIAQELEAVAPELVHEDEEGYKQIAYPQLTAPAGGGHQGAAGTDSDTCGSGGNTVILITNRFNEIRR